MFNNVLKFINVFFKKKFNFFKDLIYLNFKKLSALNSGYNYWFNYTNISKKKLFGQRKINFFSNLIKYLFIVFLFSVVLLFFFYLYTLDVFLLFYPDKIISFLNSAIDDEGVGFTFIFSFLPFSNYFFHLKTFHVGIFKDYKTRIQQRFILLLQYLGDYSPLFQKNRLYSKFFLNVFFSKMPIWEKSRLYTAHKLGSFNTKDFILNFHKKNYWFNYPTTDYSIFFNNKNFLNSKKKKVYSIFDL